MFDTKYLYCGPIEELTVCRYSNTDTFIVQMMRKEENWIPDILSMPVSIENLKEIHSNLGRFIENMTDFEKFAESK